MASSSAEVRAGLSHPVIDADAHWIEPYPVFVDYLASVGAGHMVDEYDRVVAARERWYETPADDRTRLQVQRPGFWTIAGNTLDYATVNLPSLYYERLDEFGIDFALIYPSIGLTYMPLSDSISADLRIAACRAYNVMAAELFQPYADRMTPVAVIPTNTPEEAIAELEFAIGELRMKAIVINGHTVRQPSADGPDSMPTPDFYALDSAYDYDPFWQRCVDLRVPVAAHGSSARWSMCRTQNYTFNHIGHFAHANAAFCKAVTMGGVPRRFPELRFAFLEGGVGYVTSLYSDLVEHYKLRNVDALERYLRPTNIDPAELAVLWEKHAPPSMTGCLGEVLASINPSLPHRSAEELATGDEGVDEVSEIPGVEALTTWFSERYFFGCEAEDRTSAYGFDGKIGTNLNPILGSDIGHFDVHVAADVLRESWELVEENVLSEAQYEKFVFRNAAVLHSSMNPAFFAGTVVETQVAELLATNQ